VAFLGLGIMGSRMAANLARRGFELTVWNRTAGRAEEFASRHPATEVAASPQAAATTCEVVISMVVDAAQVEAVLLGPEGAAQGAPQGALLVDCSTIGVAAAQAIGARLRERDLRFLDAPVTGSSPKAQDGTLTIMVGGPEGDFERARPVFDAMGSVIVRAGPVGHGQLVKVINNAVAATNASVLGQALLVASAAGADLDALTQVMGAGSGGSAMLDLKAGPMRRHDYATLFKLDHMLKDVRLCLQAAQAAGIAFPAAQETAEILADASARGFGEADFAALVEALESAAGRRL
jgi:3-hydroxyisobutyrate dehydrogenase-like beta-hydroxyacid dehydrogenase